VLLAEDETDLLLFPPLRACGALRGRPAEVLISGRNARRVVFGVLNLRTGTRLFLSRERQRAVDFQDFLGAIRWHYRGWYVALLRDEDPSHTKGGSPEVAESLRIGLIWLPKRAPKLNPMDHLWWYGKEFVSANRQSATIDDQVDCFTGYLAALPSEEALQKAGVLSRKFWLRRSL
jgi:hypothetical protein